jgi:tetratricopeptide (TPR) repeat protein
MSHRSWTWRIAIAGLSAVLSTGVVNAETASEPPLSAAPPRQSQFLSDSDPAYLYLETLQEEAYRESRQVKPWTNSPEDQKRLQDLLARLDARSESSRTGPTSSPLHDGLLSQLREAMPTRYEHPSSLWLLRSVAKEIFDEVIQEHPSFELPRLGTLPLGTLNARALSVPGVNTKLLIVNASLFSFAHELGKIALATIPITATEKRVKIDLDGKYFAESLRKNSEFLVRFSKAMEDFANQRQIRGHALPRVLDDPLLIILDSALEGFVLAHEFGHLALQHQTEHRLGPGNKSSSGASFLRSWGEEAQADLYAAEVVNRLSFRRQLGEGAGTLKGQLAEFSRYAPVLFFQLNKIAEGARYIRVHGQLPPEPTDAERKTVLDVLQLALTRVASSPETSSENTQAEISIPTEVLALGDHPPAWAREILMRTYWRDRTPARVEPEETAFGNMAVMMGNHLESLWSDIAPIWVRISKGEKPDAAARSPENDVDKSTQAARQALSNSRDMEGKAWDAFEKRDYKEALVFADTAVDGGMRSAYFIRGRINLGLKNYRAAANDFTIRIEDGSDWYWNYANRAIAYRHLGQTAKAQLDFNRAIEHGGAEDPKVRSFRGSFLLEVGKVSEGLVDLRKAASLAPNNTAYQADLAEALVYTKKYPEAIEAARLLNKTSEGRADRNIYRNLAAMFETISQACTRQDFVASRRLFEETLEPSNIDWSFDLMDKWLATSPCSKQAMVVSREMITKRRKLIQ